ncbi:MAG: GH3 auxin-responsive promoter family protein [Chloroflexi bacterium]|nr:GH3 auxin-responsive promoter family protein [Chloroflexota bacterium]MDA1218434.1 GH3 auxin-responsive promoter family protein [Chloroflexota bacterium]
MDDFNQIQRDLLLDELRSVHESPLGRRLLRGTLPKSIEEFRRTVRLTKYGDYLPDLENGNDSALPEPGYRWVHTTGARAEYKHIPYTLRAYEVVLDNVMAAFILSCANGKGEVNIGPDDRALYNTPPRPFLSGLLTFDMADRFGFSGVLDPLEAEGMEFKERIEKGFHRGLTTGVDILVSMSSILVKIGEEFANHQKQSSFSPSMLHPAALARLGSAYVKSKLLHRELLPKDLWSPKGILAWGIDTPFFRKQVEHYWGIKPFEFYSCTEGGVMAMQGWNKKGMTLIPYSNFFEFIPEEESAKSWEDANYTPTTLLTHELEVGKRYEIVITNLHGMPLLRYRVGHLIKVIALADDETGVKLPQIAFEARCDDRIDLAGFTRMDEKTFWEALTESEIGCADWIIRKESTGDKPTLHLYGEFKGEFNNREIADILDRCLKDRDPFYRDLQEMLGIFPLQVTTLQSGTFDRYYDFQTQCGLPLTERRPSRLNASNAELTVLLRLSAAEALPTRQVSDPVSNDLVNDPVDESYRLTGAGTD